MGRSILFVHRKRWHRPCLHHAAASAVLRRMHGPFAWVSVSHAAASGALVAEPKAFAQAGGGVWAGSTALAIAVGPSTDELRYLKSVTLHLYLFGYELPGTCRQVGTVLVSSELHLLHADAGAHGLGAHFGACACSSLC